MLTIKNVNVFYGQAQALNDVSIHVENHEIISIIGSNGAGKTTLMKSIMNLVKARSGEISFMSEILAKVPAYDIVKRGIVYIPEGREIFPNMTVLENLEMGSYSKVSSRAVMNTKLAEIYELFPRLKERQKQKAGSLSGGEQQMLAIGRGLMSEPKLLMCDEPSLGLAPVIVDEMFNTIVRINKEKKIPILLVEQNAYMALSISNRCYVLENGHIVREGESSVLIDSPDIKKAYLGG